MGDKVLLERQKPPTTLKLSDEEIDYLEGEKAVLLARETARENRVEKSARGVLNGRT